MLLIDHVSIGVLNMHQARVFYDAIMSVLGAPKVYEREKAIGYGERCSALEYHHSFLTLYLTDSSSINPKQHLCFKANSHEQVQRFYDVGIKHGGQDNGKPNFRPKYHTSYYAAFLCDPFGNQLEVVCHKNV